MQAVRSLYDRFQVLIHELAKFGVVGAVCLVIDLGIFYALHNRAKVGPLTSTFASTVVAASAAYAGNRLWSFRHRANSGLRRELSLFMALNAMGLVVQEAVVGFVFYVLGAHSAALPAKLGGIFLGTLFRFWAYKRWVFLHRPAAAEPAADRPRDEVEAEAVLQV